MPASTERKLELLTKLLQRLGEKGKIGVPIIVEGKKDLLALRKLGIKGRIICIKKSRKILVDFLDGIQSAEVVLFVDFDNSGVSLAKRVTQYLERKGVKIDFMFWRKIRSLVRKDVRDVEGIPSYLENLKRQLSPS